MDKFDKDVKVENDKLSEAGIPDETLEEVTGGSHLEEFRLNARKEDKGHTNNRVFLRQTNDT